MLFNARIWVWSSGLQAWDEIVEPEKLTLKYVSRKFYKGKLYCVYCDEVGRFVAITDFNLGD